MHTAPQVQRGLLSSTSGLIDLSQLWIVPLLCYRKTVTNCYRLNAKAFSSGNMDFLHITRTILWSKAKDAGSWLCHRFIDFFRKSQVEFVHTYNKRLAVAMHEQTCGQMCSIHFNCINIYHIYHNESMNWIKLHKGLTLPFLTLTFPNVPLV